jgi:hypothetical protein
MLLHVLFLAGCTGQSTDSGLAEICNAGSEWTDGTQAFVDASGEWGLPDINAFGVVINAVDFDGDGWTDLAIRHHGGVDDFSEGGKRNTWLLRNTGSGFTDVTESSGVLARRDDENALGRPGQVWAFGDVDNDGDLDLYTGCPGAVIDCDGQTNELMLNDGDGTFSLGPSSRDLRYDSSPGGASFVDVDRDGHLDLWVAEYNIAQDRLYGGDGQGNFTDNTNDAGLTTAAWSAVATLNSAESHTNAWSALACDLNNDGDPELLAASYGRAPNHLWQATGSGTYENRSIESGYAFDEIVDWSDNESARCWCKLNPTDQDCEGVPEPESISCTQDSDAFRWDHSYDREAFRLGGNSGKSACADIDNDGWMDLVTSEIVHWDVGASSDPSELLLNTGSIDVAFDRPGRDATGLVREHVGNDWNEGDITNSVFDFDLDGWPDIYIGVSEYSGNRGLLYHQASAGLFEAVPIEVGIDHYRSHGSVVADFDRDGDLDLVVGHSSSRCDDDCYDSFSVRLFENQMGDRANFVQLRLVGTNGTNAAAIGARVSLTAGNTTQTQDVDGGHGHYGNQDDLVLTFGLGTACSADVTVRWPDAELSEQTFTVGGGYRYLVTQGEAPVVDP